MYRLAPARNGRRDHWRSFRTSTAIPSSLKPVGRPVIHSTSGKVRKTPPTTNNDPACRRSVALIQPISSPVEWAKPLLIAWAWPRSGSLTQ